MNDQNAQYRKYQKLVAGKNINHQTLLATDYLNHFNEIHMLIDMIPDMPDCMEDIMDWKVLSYQEHFHQSGFADKKLAIEAYEFSPDKYKIPFETCVDEMNALLLATISKAKNKIENDELDTVNVLIDDYSPKMEKLIEKCSAIINSKEITSHQDVIDNYFDEGPDDETDRENTQDTIDSLFD